MNCLYEDEELVELKAKWENGEIDEVDSDPDPDLGGDDISFGVRYECDADVTIFVRCFFEGYFNDGIVEEYNGVQKGRASWETIVEYFEWKDE